MIEIRGRITPEDYVRAQHLHLLPRPWIGALGLGLVALYVVTLVSLIALLALGRGGPPPWVVVLLLAAGVYLAGAYLWYLPWKARRVYRQTKALQAPFRMQLTDEGIFDESEHGESRTPWDHVLRWKEGRHLFLVYHPDLFFQMIPKRCLASEAEADAIREMLRSHAGPAA